MRLKSKSTIHSELKPLTLVSQLLGIRIKNRRKQMTTIMGTLHRRRTSIASTAHLNSEISSRMALETNREVIMILTSSAREATSSNDRTIMRVPNNSSNRKMNGKVLKGTAIKNSGMQIKSNNNSISVSTSKRGCGKQKRTEDKKKPIVNGPSRKMPRTTILKISDARDTR